jgi:hypothetical protein
VETRTIALRAASTAGRLAGVAADRNWANVIGMNGP